MCFPWSVTRRDRQTSLAHWADKITEVPKNESPGDQPSAPAGEQEPMGAAKGAALHHCRGNHGHSKDFIKALWALSRGQTTYKGLSGNSLHYLLPDLQSAGDPTRSSLSLDTFGQKSQCLSTGRTQPCPCLAFLCWFTTTHKLFLGSALWSRVKPVDLVIAVSAQSAGHDGLCTECSIW